MIQVTSIDQLPVQDAERQRTDNLCTYISTILAIIIFAIAIFKFNPSSLTRFAYPTDLEGRACGIDLPQFPFVYQTSLNDPLKRLCVSNCPKTGDMMLSCAPTKLLSCKRNINPLFEVNIYDSIAESKMIGARCVPTDEVIRQYISSKNPPGDFLKYRAVINGLKISAIFALAAGAIIFFIVQCFPLLIARSVILGGVVGLLALTLLCLFLRVDLFKVTSAFKIIFMVVLVLIALMLLYTAITKPLQLEMCSILLKYASVVVSSNCCVVILYLILFIIATSVVFSLGYFQALTFIKGDFVNPGLFGKIMSILVLFQTVWALFFLKQAYNLILSGYGINWYFSTGGGFPNMISPLKNLLCYHWGSVIAGSFLNMIFWFPSLIFHYIIPSRNESITSTSCMTKFLFQTCYNVQAVFDLCRTQAFAYINLTGVPYCNACRYVEYLSENTGIYTGSKSVNRIFLTGAHAIVLSICAIISTVFLFLTQRATSFYMVLLIILGSYFFATYFLSLHCYIADGILITLLTQEYLSGGYQMMVRAPLDLKQQAYKLMNKPVQL